MIMAKTMPANDFALLGLVSVLLAYSVLIAGAEFHTYSNRALVICEKKERANIVKNTVAFYFFSYIIIVPFLLLLVSRLAIPKSFFAWIVALFFLEHISLELSRIMIAASKQVHSGISLFIRSAMWCVAATPVILMGVVDSLRVVFAFWSLSSLFSILYAIWVLRDFADFSESRSINLRWITKGIPTAASMLAVAASIQGIFTLDRVFLASESDSIFLASYILYATCATTIVSIVDSGMVVFYTPKILAATESSEKRLLNILMKSFGRAVFMLSTSVALAVYFATLFLLKTIGKTEYLINVDIFPVILLALYIYSLSSIPHTKLYALRKEYSIMKIQIISLVIFIASSYFGIEKYGVRAVPYALFFSMLANFSFKFYLAKNSDSNLIQFDQ